MTLLRSSPMLALALAALLASPAAAAFTVLGFELVYSYPVETSLQEPDLRQTADVWPALFDAARRTIDVEQFYLTPSTDAPVDPVLEPSLQALARAAKRGVRVRVLLERKFAHNSIAGLERLTAIPGLEVRFIEWSKVGNTGKGIVHAKFIVVDSSAAYVGSANFDWRALDQIHELGLVAAEPPVVAQTQAVFDHDWALAGGSDWDVPVRTVKPEADDSRRAVLVASPWRYNPDGVGDSESALVRLLGSARRTLVLQTYDYLPLAFGRDAAPYRVVDDALRAAAARGVKVKLLVDRLSEDARHKPFLQELAALPGVEVRAMEIPDAARGHIDYARVVHSKYAVVDDAALWLGTSNFAGGYLDESRNLELVVKDAALARRVAKIHEHLWGSPYARPMTTETTKP